MHRDEWRDLIEVLSCVQSNQEPFLSKHRHVRAREDRTNDTAYSRKVFKFDGGVLGLFIKERCCLSLEVLEQSHELD